MAMSTPVVPSAREVDPSVLTTQQLQREITMLRELIEAQLDSHTEIIDQLRIVVDKIPALQHEEVENLHKLHDERFNSVGKQFEALKETIIKSDAATTKQIDSISNLFYTTTNGLRTMIDDLKASFNGMTGHSKGTGDTWGYIFGAAGFVGVVVAIIFTFAK